MSNDNEQSEWERWTRDYHDDDGVPPPPPPVENIAVRVQRESLRMKLGALGEVLGALFVIVFWCWTIAYNQRTEIVAMAGVSFALVLAWVGFLFHTRRGVWTATGQSTKEHLRLILRRRKSEVRWFTFAQLSTAGFGLFVAVWAPFMVRAHWQIYAREPWRGIVGFGVAIAILAGCLWYYTRRADRARREVRALQYAQENEGESPLKTS